MSALFGIAAVADRMGLRPWLARAATIAYPRLRFEVDASGHWVNHQPEVTFVSPSLHTASYAEVERAVLDNWAWDYMPRAGDTVIDVGAGIGEEAIVFSRLVGVGGRIIAIEAHPQTFACLEKTIEQSGVHNVTAVNCAIADRDGELSISPGPSHLGPSHLMNTVLGGTGGSKVIARTLDSIADELGLGEVALLKMNIEGAEKMAIDGFDRVAPRVRHAAISCHDFVANHFGGAADYRTKEYVCAALKQRGFTISTRPDAVESWIRDYLYAHR